MVGPLINILPARVRIEDIPWENWLKKLQSAEIKRAVYNYSTLEEICKWCKLPEQALSFGSIIRFQNYPFDPQLLSQAGVALQYVKAVDYWHYPLNLMITPGNEIHMELSYSKAHFSDDEASKILNDLTQILDGLLIKDSILAT